MNINSNNRNTLLLAFILLMLGAVALAESAGLVVMILIGLLFLVRQFDNNQLNAAIGYDESDDYYSAEREREWEELESREHRQAQSEPVYRHALEAVRRAGLDPDTVQVLAVDIGVMAFRGEESPTVFRTWSLPDNVDYVQPFVQLRLPEKAVGRVKFEIIDQDGTVIFSKEEAHNLERGRNFISPAARFPVHDETNIDGRWQLRVSADDVILAVHQFEFSEATNANISRHIGEDGEINTELRAVMAESKLPKMSLDDLLSYQEEEEAQQGSSSS
ncbi:hypothetical protein G4Y79_23060 [Phototrophicus methaneseepsis]|uniref:Uncharacterized protein n=1 Tax=Phototrophicus methaneseepsis TaxID=2710758 RepID=A0A7S8IEE9_9CHLR|nr:hypothetical protein [Phototrophicus methaneseepsis]QPC82531.1 hypothetical protein G4Y79_23060 [Phototrophicus methaneseepsis]